MTYDGHVNDSLAIPALALSCSIIHGENDEARAIAIIYDLIWFGTRTYADVSNARERESSGGADVQGSLVFLL